ncbi:transferrin receptor protein 1-like [Astyanax mexicanus]|uniref:transferrin receptor protein 1-like n=1 Tax=Astyanax mexicanus TaxID=7994 RepID=UPI0020CAC3FF|nr:transferrin receptor protein 1-like [Astyanax mexicanus]XP_049332540.1 transferrin receptor protein 1-like [Astyanax mexicanus]
MEDNNSQVELVLSSDLNEEEGSYYHFHQSPTSKPRQFSPRNICLMISATVFVFIFGVLIGYFTHPKADGFSPSCAETVSPDGDEDDDTRVLTTTVLDWSNLTALLKNTLNTKSIEDSLRLFSSDTHEAGSLGDEELGEEVLRRFRDYSMTPWTDEHFISVLDRFSSGTSRVNFRGAEFDESGFLAYSAKGLVKGAVLYAYYGEVGDFKQLQDLNISTTGRIVLVRAGKISYAEKVANAAAVNASAVLIYPDPADYSFDEGTDLFGHVHLGCGDPYTPGFPSFKFPPAQSSGLPTIPAQTIRPSTAAAIMRRMGGPDPPQGWGDGGLRDVQYRLGNSSDMASVEVNITLTVKKILNVFGVIRGFQDPDRYVVIGAQRDAWGPGYAKSTVGTSLLVELARSISEMISKNGFQPRRSIVFASWNAGEYGAVGATEWLEGYLSSVNMRAFSYISLDGVVTGSSFKASASPLMYDLIQSTLKEVSSPSDPSRSLYSEVSGRDWEAAVMEPMKLSDAAYPFLAFSGIPSVSIRFSSNKGEYPFFDTMLDTRENLINKTSNKFLTLVKTAGEIAGQMALRLVHDHLIRLNVEKYTSILRSNVALINRDLTGLQAAGRIPEVVKMQWLMSALGSFSRAAKKLTTSIEESDLEEVEQCRIINNRIMGVERNFLSPYVCPQVSPFRHILLGSGSHTLGGLRAHLTAIKEGSASADLDLLKNQFALTTWTIQSCANALAGSVWEMDNEI